MIQSLLLKLWDFCREVLAHYRMNIYIGLPTVAALAFDDWGWGGKQYIWGSYRYGPQLAQSTSTRCVATAGSTLYTVLCPTNTGVHSCVSISDP